VVTFSLYELQEGGSPLWNDIGQRLSESGRKLEAGYRSEVNAET
jgi:hypothetical protein